MEDLQTNLAMMENTGLHTGGDKLELYRKRKTMSSKGGDKLEGNLRYFS